MTLRGAINETHDPDTKSWVESANAAGCEFPVQNLPFAAYSRAGEPARIGIGIGDDILDISRVADCLNDRLAAQAAEACASPVLNDLMRLGVDSWSALRRAVFAVLTQERNRDAIERHLVSQSAVTFHTPVDIPNFTDFYASVYHATNAGRLFRPDNPLLPNYKYVPVAYHSRRSTIDVSDRIVRPWGQIVEDPKRGPEYRACRHLDYELELGFFVGSPSARGEPVPVAEASDHIFGASLLNDWSARDIQAWEYQPLGPFLAKNFATTLAPWVVTAEAMRPFRAHAHRRAEGDPKPLPHLFAEADQEQGGLDLVMEVYILTNLMRERKLPPHRLSRGNFASTYWTVAQMLAHHTSNGCSLEVGDLIGSGTVSGPEPESWGSLLELTTRGTKPITLPSGEQRGFLEDGDTVIFRGFCEYRNGVRVGFGNAVGRIVPRGRS